MDALEPGDHTSGPYHRIAWLLAFTSQSVRPCHLTDEESSDPSLAAFLEKLRAAVKAHDANFLLSIIGDEVSVDGNNGRTGFNDYFHPKKKDSVIWPLLDKALKLHGAWTTDVYVLNGKKKQRRAFEMPTIRMSKPYESKLEEPYGYIIHNEVQIKESPSVASATIATVGMQAIVSLGGSIGNEEMPSWTQMLTADGKSGYVSSDDVYWDSDNYAEFARIGAKWMLVRFSPDIDY